MTQDYFIDTHCHLDLFNGIHKSPEIEDKLPIKTITVTNSPNFYEPNTLLFSGLNNIRVALGMHPELISKFPKPVSLFEKYIGTTKYIGEIGLDGSKDYEKTFDLQIQAFESILSVVKVSGNKILTIHSRHAAKKTIELLQKHLSGSNCKIILHWFSGSLIELKQAIDYGYFFSINHKMINSNKGKEIIVKIPKDRLLTETDAPFTFDNKVSNRLSSLEGTIKGVAEIKNTSYIEIKSLVFSNFKNLLS